MEIDNQIWKKKNERTLLWLQINNFFFQYNHNLQFYISLSESLVSSYRHWNNCLSLIKDFSVSLTCLFDVMWVLLRSLLESVKKWKSRSTKSVEQGVCWMTSNLNSLRAALQVASETWGRSLSCCNGLPGMCKLITLLCTLRHWQNWGDEVLRSWFNLLPFGYSPRN